MRMAERPSLVKNISRGVLVLTATTMSITLFMSSWLVLWPIATRGVDDLAAIMLLSTKTWLELPDERKVSFTAELHAVHDLELRAQPPVRGRDSRLPYLILLGHALSKRAGYPVHVQTDTENHYWVNLSLGESAVSLYFDRERFATAPVFAMTAIITIGIGMSFLGAWWLAGSIRKPLQNLTLAMRQVESGKLKIQLSDDGPKELADLALGFNRMAAVLRAQNENRTALLAGVSHDLRGPLARIGLAVELQRKHLDSDGHERIERYLNEMNGIIGNFLKFSADTSPENFQTVELHSLIRERVKNFAGEGANITSDVMGEFLTQADPVCVKRMLDNLIGNAVQYAGTDVIEVTLRPYQPQGAIIEVTDHGSGITPEQLSDVLKPFVRGEQGTAMGKLGSGMGLAIVNEIARLHGWQFSLHPGPNDGLIARIIVPECW